jgi:hypothetical protein
MHSLCVDGWWFPDMDQPWLDRLIGGAVGDAGSRRADAPAGPGDRAQLAAAIETLIRMVEGRRG